MWSNEALQTTAGSLLVTAWSECVLTVLSGSAAVSELDVGRRGQIAIQDSRKTYEKSIHHYLDITAGIDHGARSAATTGRSPRVVGGSVTREGSVQARKQDRN